MRNPDIKFTWNLNDTVRVRVHRKSLASQTVISDVLPIGALAIENRKRC